MTQDIFECVYICTASILELRRIDVTESSFLSIGLLFTCSCFKTYLAKDQKKLPDITASCKIAQRSRQIGCKFAKKHAVLDLVSCRDITQRYFSWKQRTKVAKSSVTQVKRPKMFFSLLAKS